MIFLTKPLQLPILVAVVRSFSDFYAQIGLSFTLALFSWKETGKPRLGILPLLRKLHFVFYIYVYFFAQAQK